MVSPLAEPAVSILKSLCLPTEVLNALAWDCITILAWAAYSAFKAPDRTVLEAIEEESKYICPVLTVVSIAVPPELTFK